MAIIYPKAFAASPSAGFDGVFDWDWLRGCFPRGIMPMDADAEIEINGRFLTFETKHEGVPIPAGQLQALKAKVALGFTVVFLWGKASPSWWRWERREIASGIDPRPCTIEMVRKFACVWAFAADRHFSEKSLDAELVRATFPRSDGRCPF